MGITGLIPFLKNSSKSVNMRDLRGTSVAVDSYCWLHKGVFGCAEKLIRGEDTDTYVNYCLKFVEMLLQHRIKVVMVFDGRHLPAKAETERRRREARQESKKLAKEYLRKNQRDKARAHMQRAVDVTHEMALRLIKECRDRGVECIVAPYEADAQMAWLNIRGFVDFVVTEDSDLTLFGAKKILFKLDLTGHALLVESSKLHLAMGCKPEKYTFEKFRRMCILSGCDYLDSLQGIGLKKACKFMLTTEEDDMSKALKKLPQYLNMKQLEVSEEYIENFYKAEATFRHMFIYNPVERRMERLNDIADFDTEEEHCSNAGSLLEDQEQALQLALGNLNPFTLEQLDNWHPDKDWYDCSQNNKFTLTHKCLWRPLGGKSLTQAKQDAKKLEKPIQPVLEFKSIEYKNMAETEIQETLKEEKQKLEEAEVFSMYRYNKTNSNVLKRKRAASTSSSSSDEVEETNDLKEQHIKTPNKSTHNPFAKHKSSSEKCIRSPICANSSLLKVLSPKKSSEEVTRQQNKRIHLAQVEIKSRFFAENVKQVVTTTTTTTTTTRKPFAARDLTNEMLKIEEKSKDILKQQEKLYLNSPPQSAKEEKIAPASNKTALEKTPTRNMSDSGIDNIHNEEDSTEDFETKSQENYENTAKETNTETITAITMTKSCGQDDVILLSDIDEDVTYSQTTTSSISSFSSGHSNKLHAFNSQKSTASLFSGSQMTTRKSSARRVGLTKPKKTQSTPTKSTAQKTLSMFGFQKKAVLKKL